MSQWCVFSCVVFFKQKTAYEMRISDWSSDVCSSDLVPPPPPPPRQSPTPDGNWQAEFQRALKICSQKGFFDRPSCSWDARNQYCEPNNAWGKVPDCPAKTF